MAIRALDLIARVSSRFVFELLPVATASVIGAMLVNHYGRQPPLPSIVVQAQPPASRKRNSAIVARGPRTLSQIRELQRGVCEA